MFWETTVNKWDIVNIHSRLLYTIPARWKLTIAFIGLLVTTTNITSFFIPLNVVYCCFEKFCTAISSVIDLLNKFVDWMSFGDGWCLMDAFRLNYFIRFKQVHSNNRWHKFHGRQHQKILWVYGPQSISPDFTFRKMTVLMVAPASSIGTLPWCPSLQNQHNGLFKNIVSAANSWKINLDHNSVPIPSLHKTTLVSDLPHSVSTVSIIFFRQFMLFSIMVWVFGHRDYTFIPYLTCYTFKMTQCNERKALISKVGDFDFILLIIFIALSKINVN